MKIWIQKQYIEIWKACNLVRKFWIKLKPKEMVSEDITTIIKTPGILYLICRKGALQTLCSWSL